MRLISIFTFLMSSMVMYRSNSDHNVVCRDILFRIKRNLGPFLVTFRSLLTSSEVPKVPNFCYYISGSPGSSWCVVDWCIELVIRQLKLTNDSTSTENADQVSEIFSELADLVPRVKDIALSAKRSTAADLAECSNGSVLCSSHF